MKRALCLGVLCLALACAKPPTSLRISVVNDDTANPPEMVRVTVFDDSGVAFEPHDFAVQSQAEGKLGTIVVFPEHGSTGRLRVVLWGMRQNALISQGFAVAQPAADEQVDIEVHLQPGLRPDRDADGVPDAIDVCPQDFDPQQTDSNSDGRGDACTSDGGVDRPFDTAPLDTAPDTDLRDTAPDTVPRDTLPDTRDTAPPDTRPADTRPADAIDTAPEDAQDALTPVDVESPDVPYDTAPVHDGDQGEVVREDAAADALDAPIVCDTNVDECHTTQLVAGEVCPVVVAVSDGTACGTQGVCVAGSCKVGCWISGTLVGVGRSDSANTCRTCQPASSRTDYTNLADGVPCTGSDLCLIGTCATGICSKTKLNSCSSHGTCDPSSGTCVCTGGYTRTDCSVLADNFEDGDATTNPTWTPDSSAGGWGIVSDGSWTYDYSDNGSSRSWVTMAAAADLTIRARIKITSVTDSVSTLRAGLFLRRSGSNYYGFVLRADSTVQFYKNGTALSGCTAVTQPIAPDVWYLVQFRVVGKTLYGYVNDVNNPKITCSDASYTSGTAGIGVAAGGGTINARFDDVEISTP